MNGRNLAVAIRKSRGKIAVPIYNPNHDILWVYVEKADLALEVERYGDMEMHLKLTSDEHGSTYLDSDEE